MLLEKWLLRNIKSSLQACRDRLSVSKIHAVFITSGSLSNGGSAAQLIASYARTGDLHLARKLFDSLPDRGIDSWNAMLVAYSRGNNPLQVINLYRKISSERIKPDSSTFTVAMKACTSLFDLESGREVWRNAKECGYGDDIFVGSSVLNLFAKCGEMGEAMSVFGRMSKRDVVSWSTMIAGFVKNGRVNDAVDVYRMMQKEGVEGDGVAMLAMIQACANIENLKIASSLHGYMIRRGVRMNVMVQTSLIDMYSKNGNLDVASRLFRTMSDTNIVSWSTLISGYAQNGYPMDAFELLIKMQNCGFEPDSVSLVSALLACSQVGYPILGKEIHGYIVRRHDMSQVLGTALIDMYAKCGSLHHARLLYDQMSCRDLILWNTIISSYGIHGRGEEALSIFHQMIEDGNAKPDHATFASLLSAMSHSGLVDEGLYWFNVMLEEYKIRPMEKHYVSLIDLLARGGRVEEARNLIKSMEFEPSIAVWVALLSGCLNHKKFLIGEFAAKKVLESKPEGPGIYALVSNFFAAATNWGGVAKMRKVMKTEGMKKFPGYSAVEVNGRLHAFMVEDNGHPWYDEIARILEGMEEEMRDMGYVPKLEFEMGFQESWRK